LEALEGTVKNIHRHWYRMLSAAIVRESSMMLVLGTMRAEERIAALLVDLSQRWQARGYSASDFVLKMSRRDIACYLGLKLETVSRTLQSLHRREIINVNAKDIHIVDLATLEALQAERCRRSDCAGTLSGRMHRPQSQA
jgi:CRP/FNR family transcriptional regulator